MAGMLFERKCQYIVCKIYIVGQYDAGTHLLVYDELRFPVG